MPLLRHARQGPLTLLTAARDLERTHLPLLSEAILQALHQEDAADREPASPPCYRHQFDES
ncbi:DUF488 family protein, N3 subclade [Halomonas jincaotanensis]|uniref:DUF488 family protein, N3 subclade n=1 Tax=Halomonas jincaotanensis TaxID=2810616 RepID=UPI003872BFA1